MSLTYSLATSLPDGTALILPIYDGGSLPVASLALSDVDRAYLPRVEASITKGSKSLSSVVWPDCATPCWSFTLGKRDSMTVRKMRLAIRALIKACKGIRQTQIAIPLSALALDTCEGKSLLTLLVLEATLSAYEFKELKGSDPDDDKGPTLSGVTILIGPEEESVLEPALSRAVAIGLGLDLARDLANRPGNICYPETMAESARQLAKTHASLKVNVLDETKLAKMEGFAHTQAGLLLAVGRSSERQPRLVTLEYRGGAADAAPLALVGKGITFDTGGVNVKPWKGMRTMYMDMSGAAAVLGAMQAIATLGLPVNVVGVLALAENAISGSSMRPSDVVKALDGTMVEIAHTDAEGRLVLADALAYVHKFKPHTIIDAATLTGSAAIALGPEMCACLTKKDALGRAMRDIGNDLGEPCWRLPMTEEYEEIAKSSVADLSNVGKYDSEADAIAGAMFLNHFAKDVPYIHLDIAPTDRPARGSGLDPDLASGAGVRLFFGAAEVLGAEG